MERDTFTHAMAGDQDVTGVHEFRESSRSPGTTGNRIGSCFAEALDVVAVLFLVDARRSTICPRRLVDSS